MLKAILRKFIRTSAFLSKEIYEILRQPRLIISLVLGPFLILLLFGIGYRNEARALRTIFVVEEGGSMEGKIEQFAQNLGPQLIYVGTTSNLEQALEDLRRKRIDLVAVTPPDAYEKIRNNEQALFTLYHNEIDPFQADYVQYFGKVYIDEVNRRILQTITDRSQNEALSSRENLSAARGSAEKLRLALEQGDAEAAQQHQRELDQELDAIEITVGSTIELLEGVQETLGNGEETETEEIRENISQAREETTALEDIRPGQRDYDDEAEGAARVEENLEQLDSRIGEVQQVNSRVLVSPFASEARSIAEVQPELADYFAPSVVVLLLQHLAVTFAALSIVRETQLGAVELFRISPISAGETLIGKYLSYMIFGGVLAAILTGLIIYFLGVPMLGLWQNYALVVAALLFAALGIGFVISLIVETDSQAVQYAMILLLSSVFFSGFFLSLETLWEPVRVVSWMLPATYGILLLQDIMLRGSFGNPILVAGLTGIGLFLYLVAWLLLQRRMRRS